MIVPLEYEIEIDSLQTTEDFQVLFRDIMEAALGQAVNVGMILDLKRSARPRGRAEQLEISQLEQVTEELDIRANFFRYALKKVASGALAIAKCRDIASQYVEFRDAQTRRFSTDAPQSLSQSTITFYQALLASIEGRPTSIQDLAEMLRNEKEKKQAAAGEAHIPAEMQAKVNRFITATAMAKASRNVGMSPKTYVKQAQFLLDELRAMGYPRIGWLEGRMREVK